MRRRFITVLLPLLSSLAAVMVFTGPADASIGGASCLHIGTTIFTNQAIIGSGSIDSSCSGTATITIQRSRWFGWERLTSATMRGSGASGDVGYVCAHTGTHDFRTIIEATALSGQTLLKISNVVHAVCST